MFSFFKAPQRYEEFFVCFTSCAIAWCEVSGLKFEVLGAGNFCVKNSVRFYVQNPEHKTLNKVNDFSRFQTPIVNNQC